MNIETGVSVGTLIFISLMGVACFRLINVEYEKAKKSRSQSTRNIMVRIIAAVLNR